MKYLKAEYAEMQDKADQLLWYFERLYFDELISINSNALINEIVTDLLYLRSKLDDLKERIKNV